jgi:hypothetical protein
MEAEMREGKYFIEILFVLLNLLSIALTLLWVKSSLTRRQTVSLVAFVTLLTTTGFFLKYKQLPFGRLQRFDSYFVEHFDSDVHGWNRFQDSNQLIASVENSRLHIFPRTERHIEILPQKLYSNFILSAEFTRERGHGGDLEFGNGIVFRYTNDAQYYVFLFTGNGDYKLLKYQGGKIVEQEWRKTEKLRSGYEKNLISILASGPDIAVYANGDLIHYQRDTVNPHLLGKIGFYITSGSNIFIDNLSVAPVDLGVASGENTPQIADLSSNRSMAPFIR